MKVHIIGSGCPVPRVERYGSAFILEVGKVVDTLVMVCTHIDNLQTSNKSFKYSFNNGNVK